MAQYFYDFKDLRPGTSFPNGLVGLLGPTVNSNFYQEFSKEKDGMIDWAKNSDAGTGNFSATVMYGPDVSSADVECLVKLVAIHYNGGGFTNDGPSFYGRLDNRSNYQNGYEIGLPGTITSASTFARKRVAGASTTLSGSSGGRSKAVPIWIRYGINGTNIRVKTWNDGASEPASWDQTWTDSSISAAGYFGFGMIGMSGTGYTSSAGRRYKVFQLSFGTGADAAPSSLSRVVAGTLLKPDGGAANGYLVRCYSRVTGALLGETLSNSIGSFSFTVAYTDKVYCVGIDQLGNSWNAPVKDLITPSV